MSLPRGPRCLKLELWYMRPNGKPFSFRKFCKSWKECESCAAYMLNGHRRDIAEVLSQFDLLYFLRTQSSPQLLNRLAQNRRRLGASGYVWIKRTDGCLLVITDADLSADMDEYRGMPFEVAMGMVRNWTTMPDFEKVYTSRTWQLATRAKTSSRNNELLARLSVEDAELVRGEARELHIAAGGKWPEHRDFPLDLWGPPLKALIAQARLLVTKNGYLYPNS